MVDSLCSKVNNINWIDNVNQSFDSTDMEKEIFSTLNTMAIWSLQFENSDKDNPALAFIREMQVSLQQVAVLLPLCLYKSASATIRSSFECALYYTYFRSHPSELATLMREEKYYMSKADIIEYHNVHTPNFKSAQAAVGLTASINKWYSKISAITHGQNPGVWTTHTSIEDIGFSHSVAIESIKSVSELKTINSNLFLCTMPNELWVRFDPKVKDEIFKGRSRSEIQCMGY